MTNVLRASRGVIRAQQEEAIAEAVAAQPARVAKVLSASPDLLSGIGEETIITILRGLADARESEALEAMAASRRCPKSVRRHILAVLFAV